MNRISIIILILLSISSCKKKTFDTNANQNETSEELSKLIVSQDINKKDIQILIDKSDYTLSLTYKGKIIKTYASVFGENPIDDKLMEGDRCTPEGQFSVRDFYPHKKWSKFIWIDYPTPDSWKKYNTAKANKSIPSEATIGGEIGIHGVPEGFDSLIVNKTNWTWGCISLTNKDINEIYPYIFKGMKIDIRP
jgi:murein L,D-transpeptidase YafK